jgi:hypothetical protein
MSRGVYLAVVLLIMLDQWRRIAEGKYGPYEISMWIMEFLVVLLIAYEILFNRVLHRRTTKNQERRDNILAFLSMYMTTGQELQRSLSESERTDIPHANLWVMTVTAWSDKTSEFLGDYSPRARAAFLLVRDLSAVDIVITKSSGYRWTLPSPVSESYQRLLMQLDNLNQIMEKAEIYFREGFMETETQEPSQFQKFNAVMKKMLAVPREELKKREKAWRQKRARKKRASS